MKTYKVQSTLVIQLSGLLNSTKADYLYQTVVDSRSVDIILIDIKDVNFIDQNGLKVLSNAFEKAKENEVQLFVCSRKTKTDFDQSCLSSSSNLPAQKEFCPLSIGDN